MAGAPAGSIDACSGTSGPSSGVLSRLPGNPFEIKLNPDPEPEEFGLGVGRGGEVAALHGQFQNGEPVAGAFTKLIGPGVEPCHDLPPQQRLATRLLEAGDLVSAPRGVRLRRLIKVRRN